MAIYAQFDKDGECIQVASNQGWSQFGNWVETLHDSPRLKKLWEEGACETIPDLRSEMEQTLSDNEPSDPNVASVGHQIIHAIDAAGPAEIILITSGVVTE